ncbi:hypothetical protein BGZ63DRAFT_393875 [Mariannaea sp. PMI_226]|nr:hypothetical protein BGZ63DRAFT_393875 [Mariannaea sp. PMI_226]
MLHTRQLVVLQIISSTQVSASSGVVHRLVLQKSCCYGKGRLLKQNNKNNNIPYVHANCNKCDGVNLLRGRRQRHALPRRDYSPTVHTTSSHSLRLRGGRFCEECMLDWGSSIRRKRVSVIGVSRSSADGITISLKEMSSTSCHSISLCVMIKISLSPFLY